MSAAARTALPTRRLELRMSEDLMETLKRAAEIEDRTLTGFVIAAAHEAARRVTVEAGTVRLTPADQARFATALIDLPKPNAALKRAFAKRRRLLGSGLARAEVKNDAL